ncbi:unnamed protein product [Notodromas monacha]|uniref:Endonuclease n=1 Tax=Notodromas monacha TaxID=399045 RepID=A0A7R9BV72_9CRUS|nr:unnamed protein product [Notodromas monacha]CAG0920832.1 unnamed protein product [Notodromas monacha]
MLRRTILAGVTSTVIGAVALNEPLRDYAEHLWSVIRLNDKPGLPVFGTVSAATAVVPSASTTVASRTAQIMKFGFPGTANVKVRENFVLSFDRRLRVATWVFEHFNRESLKKADGVDRSACTFFEDPDEHPYFRPTLQDYLNSGFDRGHMAAAANHRSNQKHMQDTFTLLNVAPQVGKGFNRDSWERLERYVRQLSRTYKEIYTCTGPLFLPRREGDGKLYVKYQVIGKNHVAVPTHFFKIVVGEGTDGFLDMEVFVMPNQVLDDSISLNAYYSTPEAVERASGLLFFSSMSKDRLRCVNGVRTK